ncbi:hypothetical protein GCM10020295_68460 [Streptomyces cinereospinus]
MAYPGAARAGRSVRRASPTTPPGRPARPAGGLASSFRELTWISRDESAPVTAPGRAAAARPRTAGPPSSIGPASSPGVFDQPRRHAANRRSHMLPCMTSEPEQQIGVGTQDAFQRLWTPHRMAYIQGENKPTGPGADDGCPFCSIPAKSDEDGLIVRRGAQVYSVLNLYPYNGGHLMVVPYRHVADYTDLTEPETAELAVLTKQAMTALRTASGAQGFNIGMNQGSVAGAGIAAHLHQHIVPRWGGDTNFMPVVGHTRVLPQLLADTRKMLAEAWPAA